ncbi:MAG TPA: hypothetical protein VHY22_15825 [Chthoniobacteraceae bacterium]|jgi:hypothetical protein|nr:hypothetical protein [Chthoniobacteraceae bacterium]
MLLFKRLITFVFAFAILFPVIDIGAMVVGGTIAGGVAGAASPQQAGPQSSGTSQSDTFSSSFQKGYQHGFAAGRVAALRFRSEYGRYIALGALLFSLFFSYQLSFGGGCVWCRASRPPPIPNP